MKRESYSDIQLITGCALDPVISATQDMFPVTPELLK